MKDLEFDYLMSVFKGINGVGKKTASQIINLRDQFSGFINVDPDELDEIRLLDPEKKRKVLEKLREVDFSKSVETLYTEKILKEFLDSRYESLKNLRLEDLEINVLLVKALGFTTAEDTIEFYIYQRVTRGVVTSWGQKALEELCRVAGAKKIPEGENVEVSGKRFDLKKEKDGTTYYVQLKSGPNTMIHEIEDKHRNVMGILGMTYGTESQISSQIRGKLVDFEKRAYIGERFWELLSGEEDYYRTLIVLIDQLSKRYGDQYERSFLQLVTRKKRELGEEWKKKYQSLGEKGLTTFIEEFITPS
jgi:hypothetical protein